MYDVYQELVYLSFILNKLMLSCFLNKINFLKQLYSISMFEEITESTGRSFRNVAFAYPTRFSATFTRSGYFLLIRRMYDDHVHNVRTSILTF